jgi:hypothetical protein
VVGTATPGLAVPVHRRRNQRVAATHLRLADGGERRLSSGFRNTGKPKIQKKTPRTSLPTNSCYGRRRLYHLALLTTIKQNLTPNVAVARPSPKAQNHGLDATEGRSDRAPNRLGSPWRTAQPSKNARAGTRPLGIPEVPRCGARAGKRVGVDVFEAKECARLLSGPPSRQNPFVVDCCTPKPRWSGSRWQVGGLDETAAAGLQNPGRALRLGRPRTQIKTIVVSRGYQHFRG